MPAVSEVTSAGYQGCLLSAVISNFDTIICHMKTNRTCFQRMLAVNACDNIYEMFSILCE